MHCTMDSLQVMQVHFDTARTLAAVSRKPTFAIPQNHQSWLLFRGTSRSTQSIQTVRPLAWTCCLAHRTKGHADTISSPETSKNSSIASKRPWRTVDTRLVLEDGSIWRGKSFGGSGTRVGEVVFNTSLTGYQEILTDPSYAGQIVVMTQPHIGNTGINSDDEESSKMYLAGLVIRDLSHHVSNWRSTQALDDYLKTNNVMGISDIDTRAITRRIREEGSLIGVLTSDVSKTDEELLEQACEWSIVGKDLISGVSCTQPYEWKVKTEEDWEFSKSIPDGDFEPFRVVAYDYGCKANILKRLSSYGCKITVVPSSWPSSKVLEMKPDGVLFSNGPGDPSAVPYAVQCVKELVGEVPVFGICMGHQLLGQALGGRTFKMKFGHHGGNHPVRHLPTGRVDISSQNHNYAVDPASLPEGVEITRINLNDGTCAGLSYPAMKVMSIQYHPESSPGPHDSDSGHVKEWEDNILVGAVFWDFVQMMKQNRKSQS